VRDRDARLLQRGRNVLAVDQHFGRGQARQPGRQFSLRAFGQAQFAAAQRQPGQAPGLALARHGEQQRVALIREQFGVGQRAGGDHAHHLALDRAFL
jgi:hypothetical protein